MMFAGTGVWKSKRGAALLGCRYVFINDEQYGYNIRDELIAADEVSYNYDDIGNRTTAEGKTYTANNLNQYTAIDDFAPQYDADGNQTLIKTETGVWSVVYNAENRPVRWQSGDTVITMAFDRMGRRVEMRTVKDGAETLQRFVYDNYLCVQQLRGADNALFHSYVWDPTEPIATRPLIFLPSSGLLSHYFHDGNKNVSDLVDIQGSVVHYSYTPFGISATFTSSENPYRFSSEYMDNTLSLVYYNYRHYNPQDCRWTGRDPFYMTRGLGLYLYNNNNNGYNDLLGLYSILCFAYNEGTIIGVNSTNRNDEIEVKNVFSGNEYANDSSKQHVTDKGPIPIGEYWLGNKYIPKNHIDDAQRGGNYNWYKLYGDNGMGGKSYTQVAVKNPETGKIIYRGGFNLHTGQASNGCVTVWSDIDSTDSRYPQSKQYDHLEKFLDKCSTKKFVNPRNPNDNYVGVLLVRKCLNDCREAINDYEK